MGEETLDINTTYKRLDETVTSGGSPDEILDACLNIIVQQVESERGFIMLYDSNFEELNVFAANNIDPDTLSTTAEVSQTIINSVFKDEKAIISTNALDDPRFSDRSSVVISGLRSVLCVPISIESGLIGLIYMDNRLRIGAYRQKHLEFLTQCAGRIGEIILKLFPDTQPKPKEKEE